MPSQPTFTLGLVGAAGQILGCLLDTGRVLVILHSHLNSCKENCQQ